MHALKTVIVVAWIIFWVYWFASAFGVKEGRASRRRIPLNGLSALSVLLLLRVFRGGSLAAHSPVLGAIGAVVFASGIALAIWARVHLGQNWGMPMTQKVEPELVTSGPYRFVRHPIYSGLLAGLLGTALVTNLIGLVIVAVLGGYFYYVAAIEEKNLIARFPTAYPAYRASTKMLIPFVLWPRAAQADRVARIPRAPQCRIVTSGRYSSVFRKSSKLTLGLPIPPHS